MSDENNSGEGTGDGNSGDAGQADPQYVTQEAMSEQFKSLQDGLFSMVRKMTSQSAQPQPQAPVPPAKAAKAGAAPDPVNYVTAAQFEDSQLESKFLRQVPESLAPAQREALLSLYKTAKPEDSADWIAENAKLFAQAPTSPTARS